MRQTTRLRKLIEGDDVILAPGVYDGLSARLVEAAALDVMYASGGAIARSTGIPEPGPLSLREIGERLEQIVDAADIQDTNSGVQGRSGVRTGEPGGARS